MGNEVKEKKELSESKAGKPRKISEENLQLIANVVITAFSTAAMIVSITMGMKGKNKR